MILKSKSILPVLMMAAACGGPDPSTMPLRLVDGFVDATVEGTPESTGAELPRTEWRFDGNAGGWSAAKDVTELRVEGGALSGRSTSEQPVVVARHEARAPESELLHEVQIRARVSAGTELTVRFDRGAELVLPRALGNPIGALTTPIRAGDEMRTYVLPASTRAVAGEIGHVLVLPTNEAGAEFAIESIRLVFRGEHLRSIPSGLGWHGMSEIYRESIVTRSPERVLFDVELPAEPWLDVGVATTEPSPVTFRVVVTPEGSGDTRREEVLVEVPDRWQDFKVELDGLDGRPVRVALEVEADQPGVLGFWGAPVIRSNVTPMDRPQAVILVITDTLRADHLELYGYERETAPTLTRLAREGVLFADVVSQASWTKVSVTSIQTSLYPSTHTVADIPDRLPASATTLAEVYRKAGYATLALTSIPFVGRLTNLHQGYEELHESGAIPEDDRKPAAEMVSRLLPWLEEHRASPFFVLLHVRDPHSPFRPSEAYETTFAEEGDMDRLDELIETVKPHIRDPLMRNFGMPRAEELEAAGVDAEEFVRHEVNGLDGSIRGMDDAIARLVDELFALELSERALVGIVADHGTELLDHGAHFHGHTVYGELNRVPMLLWGPSYVPANRVVEEAVQTIDLMPTLLELSGLPVPDKAQGASLVGLVRGEERGWNRPAITESLENLRRQPAMTSIISEGWKLIRIVDESGTRYELYSHRDDPINLRDVAGEHPEVVERLAEQIERFHHVAEAAKLDDAAAMETMDSEELERLRSLGYVQ